MIYQKIVSGDVPYKIIISKLSEFPEHRHADFEFNYCVSGSFDIEIDGNVHSVKEGSCTFIPPMYSHKIPCDNQCMAITLIVGVSLLNKHFGDFLKFSMMPQVYDLSCEEYSKIKDLFFECAEMKNKNSSESELIITGNIYKILAYFLKSLSDIGNYAPSSKDFAKIKDIEKVFDLIHFNYKEPLTVEVVAKQIGYSKSSFCKTFKKYVGEGFHQTLNKYRVKCAADLLVASDLSVADISEEVGFNEPKSFCRVFKSIYSVSPWQYRRS